VTRLALLAPLIVAAGLRLFRTGLPVLTSDEAFSWRLIQYPVPELLRRAALDVHPPLYYLLLDAWATVWGTSPLALRGLSALLGVLAVAMAYGLCLEASRLDDHGGSPERARRGAVLAAVLVAIQAASVAHGRTARMYALAVLLAGVTSWLLLRALRAGAGERRWWAAYGVAVAAFCATHYYALFTVAAQGIFVMALSGARSEAGPRRWRFAAALTLAAALFSPWLPVLARQAEHVREMYWIPAPSLSSLGLSFVQWGAGAELNAGTPLPWLLALALILAWGWRRGGPGTRHLLLQALLPWVFGLAVSLLSGRPIFLERYMAFGQFFLICAWGVLWARVPTPAARTLLAAALVVLSAAGLLVTWGARYPDRPTAFWYTARYLKRQAGPGDLVITRSPRALNKLRYYAEQVDAPGLDVRYAAGVAADDDHFSHLPSLEDREILRSDPFLDPAPRTLWRLEDTRTAPEPAPPGWRITHARMFEGGDAPVILVVGYAPATMP
jgi:mannosyltransferase